MATGKDDKKDKKDEEGEASPLSIEERLDLLEKSSRTGRFALLGFALFLLVFVSAATTAFFVFVVKESDQSKQREQLAVLQQQIDQLSQQLSKHDDKLLAVDLQLPDLEARMANTSNPKLIKLMLEQEDSYQAFLGTLRVAIFDLAHMVPGSRTWLENYRAKIDLATEQSKQRQVRLNALKTERTPPETKQDNVPTGSELKAW